jgi:hypothetical protein
MRSIALTLALVVTLAPLGAGAAPSPLPSGLLIQKAPTSLSNPGTRKTAPGMNGQGCIASHVNASQTAVNPITGKPQAAPIVSIPITAHGGSVASATTRAQQAHACAHART